MTRDDLRRLAALDIDFETIGLLEPGIPQEPYFCDPTDAEYVGRLGADGVHFILLPGDERVFCVDPAMGEVGTYVLPVGEDLRQFLSFLLYCKGANPLSQIWWMEEPRFRRLLAEDAGATWPGCGAFFERRGRALEVLAKEFNLTAIDPYRIIKGLQGQFDAGALNFSDEYYDVLGLERNESDK